MRTDYPPPIGEAARTSANEFNTQQVTFSQVTRLRISEKKVLHCPYRMTMMQCQSTEACASPVAQVSYFSRRKQRFRPWEG